MRRQPPPSIKEFSAIAAAASFAHLGGMLNFGLPAPTQLVAEPVFGTDEPPVHAPLPDLCTVRTGLSVVPDSKDLDRNDAECSFEGKGTRLFLSVWRPEPFEADAAAEFADARKAFTDAGSSEGAARVGSLGDEAKILVDVDEQMAEVWVRDGLLILDVRYEAEGKEEAGLGDGTVRIASGLLRVLPPKGR